MRDPAVLAVHAVRLTAEEFSRISSGCSILRPFWPPMCCRDSIVGLHVGAEVLGEVLLTFAASDGGCAWMFGPVTTYARPLPHPAPRGMSSPMPDCPMGTLTPARDWSVFA